MTSMNSSVSISITVLSFVKEGTCTLIIGNYHAYSVKYLSWSFQILGIHIQCCDLRVSLKGYIVKEHISGRFICRNLFEVGIVKFPIRYSMDIF
jgi:hypothetical protein